MLALAHHITVLYHLLYCHFADAFGADFTAAEISCNWWLMLPSLFVIGLCMNVEYSWHAFE